MENVPEKMPIGTAVLLNYVKITLRALPLTNGIRKGAYKVRRISKIHTVPLLALFFVVLKL